MLMEELGGAFIWQVGDRVIVLNCRKPYVGWDRFKETVAALPRISESNQLIPRPSLRYIDLLRDELAADLAALKLTLKLGDREIKNNAAGNSGCAVCACHTNRCRSTSQSGGRTIDGCHH
jgi:uncharacterized protein (TIGR04255 family)